MIQETMTIHEALSELKMLDNRITRKIRAIQFCAANRHSNTKINGETIDKFKENVVSEYQSVRDLIKRRAAIRNALSRSNATTTVTVAGHEYTVAEAIEMKKTGVELIKSLRDTIQRHFSSARDGVEEENDALEERADRYVNGLFSNKDKANKDDMKATRDAYITSNTFELIDPINARDEIDKLSTQVETFEHEVDSKLSVSNAITTITISY